MDVKQNEFLGDITMYLQLFSNDTQLWPIEGVGPGVLPGICNISRVYLRTEFSSQNKTATSNKQIPPCI